MTAEPSWPKFTRAFSRTPFPTAIEGTFITVFLISLALLLWIQTQTSQSPNADSTDILVWVFRSLIANLVMLGVSVVLILIGMTAMLVDRFVTKTYTTEPKILRTLKHWFVAARFLIFLSMLGTLLTLAAVIAWSLHTNTDLLGQNKINVLALTFFMMSVSAFGMFATSLIRCRACFFPTNPARHTNKSEKS